MKRRIFASTVAIVAVAGIAATAAFGAHWTDPGITSSSIKIGGTSPLTGPASLYKTIPLADKAYFDYINAHGGVYGRKIDFTILDDGYDPSKTVPLVPAARPTGKGLRGHGQPRHRAGTGDVGLPEQEQGAAGLARHRRLVLGLLLREEVRRHDVSVDDRLAARLSG